MKLSLNSHNIREAQPSDVPALVDLIQSAYRGDSAKRGWTHEADLLDGTRTTEAQLLSLLNDPSSVFLLYREPNSVKPQGCVHVKKEDDTTIYFGMLTVDPELQASGLGGLLLKQVEVKSKELGCSKIRMSVIPTRLELIAYYERKGYRRTGHVDPFPEGEAFGIHKVVGLELHEFMKVVT